MHGPFSHRQPDVRLADVSLGGDGVSRVRTPALRGEKGKI